MKSEQIRQQIAALRPQLNGSDPKKVLQQMRELDQQLKQANRNELLERVNKQQTQKRELAAKVWECEETAEDITTADGSLHKTKVKKYPKLAALNYVHAEVKDGKLIVINYNGEKFRMYKTQSSYNEPTIYTRFPSFVEFLEFNGIMPEPMTAEQFTEICNQLADANTEIRQQIEAYKAKLNKINSSALSCYGLIGQHPEHFYTYTPNC